MRVIVARSNSFILSDYKKVNCPFVFVVFSAKKEQTFRCEAASYILFRCWTMIFPLRMGNLWIRLFLEEIADTYRTEPGEAAWP